MSMSRVPWISAAERVMRSPLGFREEEHTPLLLSAVNRRRGNGDECYCFVTSTTATPNGSNDSFSKSTDFLADVEARTLPCLPPASAARDTVCGSAVMFSETTTVRSPLLRV